MNGNRFSTHPARSLPDRSLIGNRGLFLGAILLVALVCFESFNFSTTQVALQDLLGGLSFAGVSWATILAVAFCGIDFAGIARMFLPEDRNSQVTSETWYLFGAWLLAATMNAMLTWWGVSLGLIDRSLQSTAFIRRELLLDIVPVMVALLVWLTRILLIGAFSLAGPRLFSTSQPAERVVSMARSPQRVLPERPAPIPSIPSPLPGVARPRPNPQPHPVRQEPEYVPDPSYAALEPAAHSLGGRSIAEQPAGRKTRF